MNTPSFVGGIASPVTTLVSARTWPGALLRAVEALISGELSSARELLEDLLQPSLIQQEPQQRVSRLFASSLMARLQGDTSETGNLYQDAADPDAMLAAFQTLVHATPFIQFGYAAANVAIYDATADAHSIHIMDIGMALELNGCRCSTSSRLALSHQAWFG